MSDEDKGSDVDVTLTDKEGKHPENVPWNQYVGVKESLGKKVENAQREVTSLKEQLGKAVKQEDYDRIKQELDSAKAELAQKEQVLGSLREKSVSEKKEALIKQGIPEDKVKGMSETELVAALTVLGFKRPAPDMGGGGGASPLTGRSPQELAASAYNAKR